DLGVMRRRLSFLVDEPDAYLPAMRRVAELEPSAWLVLARYLLLHDRDDDAASALQKAVDAGDDPITVSTQVPWLADYYLDHHQDEAALAVGETAAATVSAGGKRRNAPSRSWRADTPRNAARFRPSTSATNTLWGMAAIARKRVRPPRASSRAAWCGWSRMHSAGLPPRA